MPSNAPQLVVECAFSTDPDSSQPAYQDISAYTLGFSSTRGRQRELDVMQASVLNLRLANSDRRFDPTYTKSPYYPYVLPMRKIRVSAIWNSVTYYLFTGFVERWPISWDAPKWESVNIVASDGYAALSSTQLSGTFPTELSGSRVARVLSAAAWPASTPQTGGFWTLDTSQLDSTAILSYGIPVTIVDAGQELVQAVTLSDTSPISALQHIQDVTLAERGVFFIDGQGRAIFQDRAERYVAASLVTFTDSAFSASRLPYQMAQPDYAVDLIINEAVITATGGTAQTAINAQSRQNYLRRTLNLTIPVVTDAAALNRGSFEVALRGDPQLEFTALTAMGQGNTASWPYALGLELGNRVTVERAPDSIDSITPETISRDCFVEGIQHAATPSQWTTTFQLSPASGYDKFFKLDHAVLDSGASALLAL